MTSFILKKQPERSALEQRAALKERLFVTRGLGRDASVSFGTLQCKIARPVERARIELAAPKRPRPGVDTIEAPHQCYNHAERAIWKV